MNKKMQVDDSVDMSDVENDSVIARAFWRSLLVIFGLGALVGGLILVSMSGSSKPDLKRTVAKAPQVREIFAEQTLPKITLVDITQESGINFVHYSGREGERLLPETMGGGGGFIDFDNDRDQDILLVSSSPWPWAKKRPDNFETIKLYQNDGSGNFEDVTDAMNLKSSFYGMGPAFGDYDGDGWTDIFVTGVGGCKLFHNDKGLKFTDVTLAMGVQGAENEWSCPAMWFDYDHDGRLDLMVGHYVEWSRELDLRQGFTLTGLGRAYGPPTAFGGRNLKLYHNTGTGLEDVSKVAGVEILNPATKVPIAKTLGLVLADANFDGWLDVVVANDTVQNFLLLNQKDGTFKDIGPTAGIAYDRNGAATGAMGIDSAFFRNDENIGIAIGNFANEPCSLYVSHAGKLNFSDKAGPTGFGPQTKRVLTFGLFFADMDLDGRQDLLCANGHLEEEISKVQPNQRYKQSPQLFWNAGRNDQTSDEFVPLLEDQTGGAFQQPVVGRGLAYGDIDSDGDLDVLTINNGEAAKLFRNDYKSNNRWLRIKLRGLPPNVEGIGSFVSIQYGEELIQRCVSPTKSYLSQCELPITFGFGEEVNLPNDRRVGQPTTIEVQWANGSKQIEKIQSFRSYLEIEQVE